MKKLKIILVSTAVLLAVGGNLAFRCGACEDQVQYYRFANTFYYAGSLGYTYNCADVAGTCTYYLEDPTDPNSFAPCMDGGYRYIY